MNQSQQEWKTATRYMDSFIEQECEYYENGICDGHDDKFRDNRFTKCRNCTRLSSIEENEWAMRECAIAQWEMAVNQYRDMVIVTKEQIAISDARQKLEA